ncbi:hypothetical protein HKX48_004523 [Thoreauomyces humboldtii]|nr:hypothetical protein HKX48_004523 [Thoreauomyces humboldtii]
MFCWEGAAGRTRYFSGRLGEIFVDMEEGEMGIDNHDQNRLDDVAGSILPGAAIGKKQRSHLITIGNYALRSGTPVEWTFESTGVGSRSHKATVVLEGIHYTSRAAHAKRTEAKEDAAEVACLAKGITVESVAAMSLRPAGLGATANAVALLNQHCQNNNKVMVTRFERSPKGFFTCYITIDGLGEWNSIGDFEYSRKADAKMRACHQAAKELDLRSSMKPPRVSNEGHHMDYVPNHRKASSQTPTFEPQQKRARLDTVAASTSASARSSRSNSDKREQWRQPLSSAIFESSAQAQAVPHYPFPPQVLQQSFPLPGYQQPQYTMTPQPLFPYSSTPFLPQNLMPQPFPAQPFPAPPFPAQPHTFHYSMSPPPAPAQSGLMDIETAMRVFASVLSGPALGPPAPGNQGANTSVVSSASSGPHTHANPPPAGPSHNPG